MSAIDSGEAGFAFGGSRDEEATRGRLVAPVLLLMLISLAALWVLLWLGAEALDQRAAEMERHLAQSFLEVERDDLSDLAKDYTWWDAAAANLVETPDETWADDNIGSYMHENARVAASFVVLVDGRSAIGFLAGERVEVSAESVFGPELAELIEQARAGPMEEAVPAVGLLQVGEGVQVVSVSPLTPEYPTEAQLVRAPRPVLILARALDPERLAKAGQAFGLEGLHWEPPSAEDDGNWVRLTAPSGQALGCLAWSGAEPGTEFLVRLAPALAGVTLALLILLALFFRRADFVLARQAALLSALQAEREARSLKARVLSMVSHEFRTPLTAIRSAAGLLSRYSERMSEEDRQRELSVIQTATTRLDRWVENALAMGRAEESEALGARQEVRLVPLVREVWEEVRRALGCAHRLEVRAEDPAVAVRSDEVVLRAVFANLLENAAKFSPGAERIELSVQRRGGRCEVAVRDFGVGLDGVEAEGLFEPFVRGGNAEAVGGSGLGLAVVRSMVDRLGGSVAGEAHPDGGAVFHVVFPT